MNDCDAKIAPKNSLQNDHLKYRDIAQGTFHVSIGFSIKDMLTVLPNCIFI